MGRELSTAASTHTPFWKKPLNFTFPILPFPNVERRRQPAPQPPPVRTTTTPPSTVSPNDSYPLPTTQKFDNESSIQPANSTITPATAAPPPPEIVGDFEIGVRVGDSCWCGSNLPRSDLRRRLLMPKISPWKQ